MRLTRLQVTNYRSQFGERVDIASAQAQLERWE
jgi:hypothetical protein